MFERLRTVSMILLLMGAASGVAFATSTPPAVAAVAPQGACKGVGVDEDGILQYDDVNGDGKFVYSDDRTYIGNPQPDFTANFSSTFNYKQWFASAEINAFASAHNKKNIFLMGSRIFTLSIGMRF